MLAGKDIGLQINMLNIDEDDRLIADDIIIRQIISHVLSNAGKFTQEGIIYLNARIQSDKFIISVKDNGPGILENLHDKIFTRFYQPNHSLSHVEEGLGLGLAISKGLCEVIDAKIALESDLGKGAVFSVEIPVKMGQRKV